MHEGKLLLYFTIRITMLVGNQLNDAPVTGEVGLVVAYHSCPIQCSVQCGV